MKSVDLAAAEEIWERFLSEASQEVFKCEVLQDYSAVDMSPSLEAWLNGDFERAIKLMSQELNANGWVKAFAARQLTKTRIHVVEQPYTPYLQWEIELYKHQQTGEDVLLVPKDRIGDLDLPDGDFWIFDRDRVVKYEYEGTKGKCIGADIYDRGDDIERFLQCERVLLEHAQPL